MAMGLWCIKHGISRTQYKSLRDILRMGSHSNGTIDELPETLQTLQHRTKGHIPLLPMRKQPVRLALHKLSTETAERRLENQQKDDNIPCADLYFTDMKELFRVILQSTITNKMHRGMMDWKNKDKATEMWHSVSLQYLCPRNLLIPSTMAWGSSNKTTSGEFAHDSGGKPIFVSDFVEFRCNKHGCRCKRDATTRPPVVHFGRVQCIGINQIDGSKRNGESLMEAVIAVNSQQPAGIHSLT